MALEDSVFADYAAAQGDFGGAFAAPQAQPIAAIPPAQGVPQFGGTVGQQLPAQDPMEEVKNHPVFQFYNTWKGSSKEKQKIATARLANDFPNPMAMGLPYDASVLGEPKTDKESNKPVADPTSWDKFMKFMDGNPQFLLDIGAQLLAPRQQGTSQASQIASGLAGATQRLSQRRAATAKAGLEGAKTQAETGQIVADTSKVPSEINLNNAKAHKAWQDATKGTDAAPKVQHLNAIAAALYKEFGTGPDAIYTSQEQALLAAQEIISGTADIQTKAYYDNVKENAFISGAPAAIEGARVAQQFAPPNPLDSLKQQQAAKKRARAQDKLKRELLASPKKLEAFVRKNNPGLDDVGVRARMAQIKGQPAPVETVQESLKPKAKPAVKKTLKGTPSAEKFMKTAASKSLSELRAWKKANSKDLSLRQRATLSKIIQRKALK